MENNIESEYLRERFGPRTTTLITIINAVAIIGWFLIIAWLGLFNKLDILGWLLVIVPPAVFLINAVGIRKADKRIEKLMFQGNFLSFAFLIAIIILNWNNGNKDKVEFFRLLVVSIILLLLSFVDIWVPRDNISIVLHIRSVLQTASLALLGLALYMFFRDTELVKCDNKGSECGFVE